MQYCQRCKEITVSCKAKSGGLYPSGNINVYIYMTYIVPRESNMLGAHRSFEKTANNIFPSTQTLENDGVKSLSICKIVRNKIFSAFNKLKEAFKTFDLNNDGYISKEEFLLGITALVGDAIVLTDKDVRELFQAFSDNGKNVGNKIRYYQKLKLLE